MLRIPPAKGDRVLGVQVEGAVERDQWVWVSHNVPPDTRDAGPAVIVRKVGKGRLLYFNSRIFREYLHTNLGSLRQFIRACLLQVYRPRLWVEAPSIVDAIFQQKGRKRIVTLNCCTLDRGANASSLYYGTLPPLHANINESWPLSGIRVRSSTAIKTARTLTGVRLKPAKADGGYCLQLPPVEGFTSIELE